MRVLLIESEPEDAVFLHEVLMEIGEGRYWADWVNLEILEAESWNQASKLLAEQSVDVLLLDLDLPDSRGIETFRRAQRAAEGIPMILLMGQSQESLGVQMVRHGAQDFLVKKQVECAALAHAMRNALERHRVLSASRATSTHDTLTGLSNRGGFLSAAERELKIAEGLDRRLIVMVAEPENIGEASNGCEEQSRDLAMLEAADHLREVAGPADLLARIEPSRFGITIFETDAESLEAASSRVYNTLHRYRIRLGAAIFSTDHPATLDSLLERAASDLSRSALAMCS